MGLHTLELHRHSDVTFFFILTQSIVLRLAGVFDSDHKKDDSHAKEMDSKVSLISASVGDLTSSVNGINLHTSRLLPRGRIASDASTEIPRPGVT